MVEQQTQQTPEPAPAPPPAGGSSFYIEALKQQQSDNVSIYELEDENLMDRIRHALAGEIYIPQEGKWKDIEGVKPPMNKKAVHHIMVKLAGHLDKNIKLSSLDIDKIHEMMVEVTNDILEIFWKRGQEFEIKQENMSFILHILEHQIYANYMRAKDGGERRHRETVIKSIENIKDVQTTQDTSRGFSLGLFNPFKKRGKQTSGGGML